MRPQPPCRGAGWVEHVVRARSRIGSAFSVRSGAGTARAQRAHETVQKSTMVAHAPAGGTLTVVAGLCL